MRSWFDSPLGPLALVACATLAVPRLGLAGQAPVGPSDGPLIMLYISQPLARTASRNFGLRIENLGGSHDTPGFAGPLRHQPLMALQFNAEGHMQLQIGRNVSLGRDASGWHASSTVRALPASMHAILLPPSPAGR